MLPRRLKRFWSRRTVTSRRRRHRGSNRWDTTGLRIYRGVLGAVSVAVLTYLLPYLRPETVGKLRLGGTSSERIEAAFLFHVPKSQIELDEERRDEISRVPTILHRDPAIGNGQLARLDSVLTAMIPLLEVDIPDLLRYQHLKQELPHIVSRLSDDSLVSLTALFGDATEETSEVISKTSREILEKLYIEGIIASKRDIFGGFNQRVRIGDYEFDVNLIYSEEDLRKGGIIPLLNDALPDLDRGTTNALHEFVALFLMPDLAIAQDATLHLKKEARSRVPTIKRIYGKGDVIVDKNDEITPEHLEAVAAYSERLAEQSRENRITRYLQTLAALLIAAFLTFVFGCYLGTRELGIYNQPGHLLLLVIVAMTTAAVATYIQAHSLAVYLVPTPLAAMLTTILLNPQVGLVLSFVLSLFVGNVFGDFHIAFTCALTSAVAVYSVRRVRHRNQFYQSMIFLPTSYALLIGAGNVMRFIPLGDSYDDIIVGIIVGVSVPILTIGLLPIFESLFHITTDITLLELSDLNTPLLRDLAVRAPGTYTHSLIMANLSESAAEAIGDKPLLARVGCYYHDIGKIGKPEYFAENQGIQGGRNPHDHLTPTMSTLIITAHVKDGIELAEEHGLPRAICDLIPQHHGTTVLEPFYNRAIELGGNSVRLNDFRYDGPRPQTRIAGILMLADSVESAARTLVERTPNRVRQLVRNIVQQKFTAGELDECDLTLRDLHRIEESFLPVLLGTLHSRVQYPWQKAKKKQSKDLEHPA